MGKALLVLGGLTCALAIVELGLRAVGFGSAVFLQRDVLTGWSHDPGVEGWYSVEGWAYVRINRDGWRDRDHTTARPPETLRIAVLGDSYAAAFQVERERTFWAVLERDLARANIPTVKSVEVLNFGVSGFGTGQELLVLKHRVWKYRPNLVLLAFVTGNDVIDNSKRLKDASDVPFFELHGGALVLDSTFVQSEEFRRRNGWRGRVTAALINRVRILRLVNLARRWALGARRVEGVGERGQDVNVYRAPVDVEWEEAWRLTEALLLEMHAECQARGVPFHIVTLTNAIQVDPVRARRDALREFLGVSDLFYPERRIKNFGEVHGIGVLTLAPALQAIADREHVYFHGFGAQRGRGHWNELGHEAAGRAISAWLAQELRGVRTAGDR